MNKGEREFLDQRFTDLKEHLNTRFRTNFIEHEEIKKEVKANTKFRYFAIASVGTLSFLSGLIALIRWVLNNKLN